MAQRPLTLQSVSTCSSIYTHSRKYALAATLGLTLRFLKNSLQSEFLTPSEDVGINSGLLFSLVDSAATPQKAFRCYNNTSAPLVHGGRLLHASQTVSDVPQYVAYEKELYFKHPYREGLRWSLVLCPYFCFYFYYMSDLQPEILCWRWSVHLYSLFFLPPLFLFKLA